MFWLPLGSAIRAFVQLPGDQATGHYSARVATFRSEVLWPPVLRRSGKARAMLTHSSVLDPTTRPLARYPSSSEARRTSGEQPGLIGLEQAMQQAGIVVSHARCTEIFGDDEPADHFYKVISGAVCTY